MESETIESVATDAPAAKPKYVVFDTETSGIFDFKQPADAPGQPRLASVAFILADAEGIETSRQQFYVKPEGWTVAEYDAAAIAAGKMPASQVNRLTDEFLNEKGVPVAEVLDAYAAMIESGLVAVAFNAQYDCKMMRAELRLGGRPDLFEQTKNICVMRGLRPYAADGLPMKGITIKLTVACEYFGIPHVQSHDAMEDAEAARALLQKLIADGHMAEAKVHYAKAAGPAA